MAECVYKSKLLDLFNRQLEEMKSVAIDFGGESCIYVECLEGVIQDITNMPAADVVPGNLFRELKNELCWRCGKYKDQHLGACDGCKWRPGVGR